MKYLVLSAMFTSLLFSTPNEFDREKYMSGERVFDSKCSECHVKSMPMQTLLKNFLEEKNQLLKLKAPTGNQISFRLKQQIGSRDDIEFHLEETADFVKEYLINPDKSKTVCLNGVVKYFDTMPSMKNKITYEEINDVAFFLYFLEGFNEINEYYHSDDKF